MVVIGFEDFKRLTVENNKHIYYYQMDSILELVFIVEGVFIRTHLNITTIQNTESFFSHQMFTGATRLMFRVPGDENTVPRENVVLDPVGIIDVNTAIEKKEEFVNIQKEGVE